jgi:hypothetical protein
VRRVPCIASDKTAQHCIAGLLLGVACCPDGDCTSCVQQREKMRKSGFSPAAVARSFARSRAGLLDRCPQCGFPPPPPVMTPAPMPRLDRIDSAQSGSWMCRGCDRPLPKGRRRFHSDACRREFIRETEMETDEIVSPSPPRIYRSHADTSACSA